jgi:hypothetical protein
VTVRVPISWHPEMQGRSRHEESTIYVHVELRRRRIEAVEIGDATVTAHALRAIVEASGHDWERWRADLMFEAHALRELWLQGETDAEHDERLEREAENERAEFRDAAHSWIWRQQDGD